MRAVAVSVVLAGVLGLTGACGSSTSGSVVADPGTTSTSPSTPSSNTSPSKSPSKPHHSSTGPSSPDWASCSSVWKAGARLPASYPGCNQGNTSVAADRLGCSSGQRLVRFDNHWWAAAGGVIHQARDLKHDQTYIHSAQVCRG